MKRFAFSIIVASVVVFSNVNVIFAQQETRTQNLHQAIINGDIEHVKSLLSKGADINEKNRLGGTPLHTAMMNGKWEIAELLISKGPDLNAKDNRQRTPLYLAVEKNQKKIVEILLAKGVDVNALAGMGHNALTLARSKGYTELTELLLKHGAEEPVFDMEGDMYYGPRAGALRGDGTAGPVATIQPITPARPANEPSVLDDPNEIKARVKTFAGLEKAIKQVADKAAAEERQWRHSRYDNRTLLSRAVQKQFEDEMGLIKKTAAAEKATKTVAAIDALVSQKQERSKKVYRELLQQRRLEQGQSGRGRARGRTSGRGMRGRATQQGQYGNDMADPYYGGGDTMGPMGRPQRPTRPTEQLDPQTEEAIRRWTQASPDKKKDLSKTVHEQVMAEIGSIRFVAVEEEAKKTTAAIDGLMLARQDRYDQLVVKMEEDERKAQERQQMLERRGYGRSSEDSTQQQNTYQRGRGRRR